MWDCLLRAFLFAFVFSSVLSLMMYFFNWIGLYNLRQLGRMSPKAWYVIVPVIFVFALNHIVRYLSCFGGP